ncbi:MAG: aminotransferase class III-fold pyridoxal phosphate-dependent enzyme [Planctomycetales bacterium]|nr:aminotransferase class III-fold pyridoxal phosphate-dependent enzyme [Planctomycetales bacterium]
MTHELKPAAEEALARILHDASGFDLRDLDRRASFAELGFDSLFLIQFTQKIRNKLKVKVTFRQLIEELPTLDALIEFIGSHATVSALGASTAAATTAVVAGSADQATPMAELVPTSAAPLPTVGSSVSVPLSEPTPTDTAPLMSQQHAPQPDAQPQTAAPLFVSATSEPPRVKSARDMLALEQIIAQQNQLMSMQLQLLSGRRMASAAVPAMSALAQTTSAPATGVESQATSAPAASVAHSALAPVTASPAAITNFERFGPYKPIRKSPTGGLTVQQQQSLDRFMERFIARTQRSRAHAQKHRPHFADPRGVAGYRRVWKSIVYQISVERSGGSKLWDIDGNEYIDIAMGFGLNLFGHSPEFVTTALHEQLERGVEVGPQSPLAGEVAELLCDFSRKDRVTFCNTGSEAVMAAMRLARTVTGKSKIVYFNKDYHGNFEEVLLRSNQAGNQRRTQPAAPGVPQSFADNSIVLDYGTFEALQAIRDHADEIAAVLVEPVQSADPFNKPHDFLHKIRQITRENDMAMIMDEVITGFRAAQGGAQEWFGVWGDMSTYGKVLGGGLPIGALAGSARFMDALDGGDWKYEDDSEPTADMTFFAGTFVRHPLAITAAHQVLMKIKEEGPELQESLTRKTSYLVDELNRFFTDESFPFRVAQFTSLFRFMFPPDLEYADLLYFHLLERGIFTRGWGDNCFLSTAHSDADVQRIMEAVRSSCFEIRSGGFMPKADALPASSNSPSSPPLAHRALEEESTAQPTTLVSQQSSGHAVHFGCAICTDSAAQTSLPTTHPRSDASHPHGLKHASSRRVNLDRAERISTVEEIQEGGDLPPLFCMPAADGLSLVYHDLAQELGEEQPIYGLTSPGVYGEELPLTIEEMARRFIEDIQEQFPHGPYLLMGYCSGGTIAFEAAQQLADAGEQVALVAGIETYDWGTAQSSRPTPLIKVYYHLQRLEFHLRNFMLLKFSDQWVFLKSKFNRVRARTKNWRDMLVSLFSKPKAISASGAVNMHELWRLHDAQADRYRPKPYPGKLLLIRPKKDYRSYVGKEDLVAIAGVQIVRIPAFPAGLMTPPYVSQVAKLIKEAIREGLANTASGQRAESTRRLETCPDRHLSSNQIPAAWV